jgi:excisionase family DNA binding protein
VASPEDPWLALGAASRLLGVAPDTLRRWADTGRIESFTTPGGHRRFLRSSLESLVNAPRRHRYGVERLAGSAGTISGEVHRRMARTGVAGQSWQARLTPAQRAEFRRWGQRTFNLVLEYVAAAKRSERTLLLAEAERMGALYGVEASRAGLSLAESVEAFLFYRTPVLEAIGAHLRRRAAELTDLSVAYREATAAIDGVLTALVASYREGSGTGPP